MSGVQLRKYAYCSEGTHLLNTTNMSSLVIYAMLLLLLLLRPHRMANGTWHSQTLTASPTTPTALPMSSRPGRGISRLLVVSVGHAIQRALYCR